MTSLPPPRLPGQPPDRPPIRRPDDHLPRPGDLSVLNTPPPVEPSTRRTGLLILSVIGLAVVGAGGWFLLAGRGGEAALDTETAAEQIDDALADLGDGRGDCPLDDFDDVVASITADVELDSLFDTLDLGDRIARQVELGENETSFAGCQIYYSSGEDNSFVELYLSPDGPAFVDALRDTDGEDFRDGDEFRDGTFYFDELRGSGGPGFVSIAWADEQFGVSLTFAAEDVDDVDRDALQTRFEQELPGIVSQLAGG